MMMRNIFLATALAAIASPAAYAQDATSPEQIEAVRRAVAAMEAAEVADPEDIQTLRQRQLDADAARTSPGYANDAKYRMQTRKLDIISDGRGQPHRTQELGLAHGIISSMAFYDHQGQPWPVQSIAYDRGRVSVNNDGCDSNDKEMDNMGNVVVITPCDFWTTSNMQVLLAGETRPIPFAITSGTREGDIDVDGLLTVALQSEAPRPFGRDRLGNLDTSWVNPRSRTITIDPIDYSTGGTHEIFVTPGVTTDIAFMDQSRNPWPVAEVAFAPGIVAVNGACDDESGGLKTVKLGKDSTIYLTSCLNTTGTVSVRMEGRAGAMSFKVTPARQNIVQPDGTLSIIVPGSSPVAPAPTAANASSPGRPSNRSSSGFTHDRFLDDFLFGAPPQGATRAMVSGGQGVEGWIFDGALYLRGAISIVNPAYDAGAQSSGGTLHVYKYGPPVSRILANDASGREFVLNITY